jgi:predicted MPP superfamily phosphohydrolase
MRSLVFILLITLFIVVMDLYAFRGIVQLFGDAARGSRLLTPVYWGITAVTLAGILWAGNRFQQMREPGGFFGIMLVMGIFLMLYVPKLLFNVVQLTGDFTAWMVRLTQGSGESLHTGMLRAGAVAAVLLMVSFAMGMIRGRTHIKVFEEEITISKLPEEFEGLKLVQISDMHLAGFYHNPNHIAGVVDQINRLEPDLLLFTGDMVHNFSEEMDPFVDILKDLRAPLGKFAILGNHDYGHYYQWESDSAERDNLERLKRQIRAAGFDLLLNENRKIERNGSAFVLLGVENWGKPPFPQHGDLAKAMEGAAEGNVKILMSHDPSHWDLKVRGKEPVALTLSGHTHGMQFGVEIGNFRWSPSRWTYRHWAGLYDENGQYLYVNRGLGFTGFPGRVGIRPEITLLTLTGN